MPTRHEHLKAAFMIPQNKAGRIIHHSLAFRVRLLTSVTLTILPSTTVLLMQVLLAFMAKEDTGDKLMNLPGLVSN